MVIYLKDNWTRFKYKKNYLYHISSIDRLESIKRFGLNPMIANSNRRGAENSGGIYLSSNIAIAVDCMEFDGLDKSKLIVFAVPIKKVINNLYIDLEMTDLSSYNYIGPRAGSTELGLVKAFPCKYQPSGDYTKYITLCIINKYLYNPEVLDDWYNYINHITIGPEHKRYYDLIFGRPDRKRNNKLSTELSTKLDNYLQNHDLDDSSNDTHNYDNLSIESTSKLSDQQLLIKFATPDLYKSINNILSNAKCFYFTGIIKLTDLEYLGRLVDINDAYRKKHTNTNHHRDDLEYHKPNSFDHNNYNNTSDLNVQSRFFVRDDSVL